MAKPKAQMTVKKADPEQGTEDRLVTISPDSFRFLSSSSHSPLASHPLNDLEVRAIESLIAYVAHHQKVSKDAVRVVTMTQFCVAETKDLMTRHYQNVIEYLLDLRMSHVMN